MVMAGAVVEKERATAKEAAAKEEARASIRPKALERRVSTRPISRSRRRRFGTRRVRPSLINKGTRGLVLSLKEVDSYRNLPPGARKVGPARSECCPLLLSQAPNSFASHSL